MPKLSLEAKIYLAVIGATVLLVAGAVVAFGRGETAGTSTVAADILVKSTSHTKGPETAKVTIVEFSDFQCPACKAAQPGVRQVLEKYPDQVRFVYRHFPLPSHEFGFVAAQAAEAAGLQNKFWEMHDKLFDKSPDLAKDKLIQYAGELGLDIARFAADLDSDAVRQRVLDDQADGNRAGINATPTFFITGVKFTGGLRVDQFSEEIDSRLK